MTAVMTSKKEIIKFMHTYMYGNLIPQLELCGMINVDIGSGINHRER